MLRSWWLEGVRELGKHRERERGRLNSRERERALIGVSALVLIKKSALFNSQYKWAYHFYGYSIIVHLRGRDGMEAVLLHNSFIFRSVFDTFDFKLNWLQNSGNNRKARLWNAQKKLLSCLCARKRECGTITVTWQGCILFEVAKMLFGILVLPSLWINGDQTSHVSGRKPVSRTVIWKQGSGGVYIFMNQVGDNHTSSTQK